MQNECVALAHQSPLAHCNLNLCASAESAYDLEDNKRQAKTLVVDDATELSTEQWDALTAELKGLDIGVLGLSRDNTTSYLLTLLTQCSTARRRRSPEV